RVYLLNSGEMIGNGSPKEMIDKYKQILAGAGQAKIVETNENDVLEYGNGKAFIKDFAITDSKGTKTNAVEKGTEYTVSMKVKIEEDIQAPIFACSVKNVRGVEITGTNTLVSKTFDDSVKKGDVIEISFTQKMMLQGGEYLISLGVTGFENGEFTVYHRLYDILSINVISDSDTVGFFDSDYRITVKR
ncbi:MAG: Wzt carbohydrate-binding domain-containing protein, partial [Lachnospiraceae bacterium]|nr:Wzt carbohydrate-binding domain-containing protein [Lachnospiraceae bacterium]